MWNTSGHIPVWVEEKAGLSTEQLLARQKPQGQLVTRSGKTVLNDNDLRADWKNSTIDDFGLEKFVSTDDSGRRVYEYACAKGHNKRDGWMAPYSTPSQRAMAWGRPGMSRKDLAAQSAHRVATEQAVSERGLQALPKFDIGANIDALRAQVGE